MFITAQVMTLLALLLLLLVYRKVERGSLEYTEEVGLGKGIVLLGGQWMALTLFLAAPQATYEMGIIGLLGYCLAGPASLVCFYFILSKNKTFRAGYGHFILKWFRPFYHWENFLICVIAAKLIMGLFYNMNLVIFLGLAFILYQFFRLEKQKSVYLRSLVMMILSLIAAILLPTFVYLEVSVPTVYSGVHFLAPDMIELAAPAGWVTGLILAIRFLAHHMVNVNMRENFLGMKHSKRPAAFAVSSAMWFLIPLSMGTLAFVAKASAVWPASNDEVSIQVIRQFGGQLGLVLLVVTLLVMLVSVLAEQLVSSSRSRGNKAGPLMTFVTAAGIAFLFPQLTILEVMVYSSLVWAVMVPAILCFAAENEHVGKVIAIMSVSVAAGFSVLFSFGFGWGILSEILICSCLSILVSKMQTKPTDL